jgi:hypothetical protein
MPWVAGQPCQETAGFLFKHRCDRPARGACQRCAKGICADHTRHAGQEPLCVTCARAASAVADGDPYFYGNSYYGYGTYRGWSSATDPDDFTEGDAAALTQEPAFEDDLDAS